MSVARIAESGDDPELWSTAELGLALVEASGRAAAAECRWLGLLAEFDRREGWRLDGQLSGVDWLVWRCGMSARTAQDKLRVAHELRRRPAVAAAFGSGSLSYSKVRAITRIAGADTDTDGWLLRLAEVGTVADLERAARHWANLQNQERGVEDYLARFDRRALRASRTYDGMVVFEVVVPAEEGEEALRLLDACPVDERSAERSSTAQRRADTFLELLRAGRGSMAAGVAGAERYTLHLVADVDALADRFGGRAELLDGTPVATETLRRLSCDCGVVRHLVRGGSQPLDVGTRTPVWTVAQRRSISLRDRGRCRFVGCDRRTCDVHHVRHYEEGGPTAVANGILLCPRHHTAVHEGGFRITGEPNATLTFHRPDVTVLGTSEAGPIEHRASGLVDLRVPTAAVR